MCSRRYASALQLSPSSPAFRISRSDLEAAHAKVNSLAGTLGILAEGDDAPLFFTLMNALEPADTALERIVNRLAELERPATDGTPAIATAADDFWPHTFEEWWRRLLRTTATAWTLTRTGLTA